MTGHISYQDIAQVMQVQWRVQPPVPSFLVEQRVLELEVLGLPDTETTPGVPSTVRQYAVASCWQTYVPYFITADPEFLTMRECLEERYGLTILSVPEAIMLFRDTHEQSD